MDIFINHSHKLSENEYLQLCHKYGRIYTIFIYLMLFDVVFCLYIIMLPTFIVHTDLRLYISRVFCHLKIKLNISNSSTSKKWNQLYTRPECEQTFHFQINSHILN